MNLRVSITIVLFSLICGRVEADLRAGAAVVDVTPTQFPVLVNGGMTSRTADQVTTPINARAIVVADADHRIGIVVVDSCMMPRPLLDEAKKLAAAQTQISADHILISATHTHTAPSSMGALGTDADSDYLPVLRAGIVEALVRAESHLEPAVVGWAVRDAADFTALRRWIKRPDRITNDPFGNPTVRATMHAGRVHDDVVGESGPEDPDLSMLSLQSPDGRPIAVLANFSMHYFSGQKALAADYFGLFCDGLSQRILAKHPSQNEDHPPFVAVMSHGCSGDIWRRDYTKPPEQQTLYPEIEAYTNGLLDIAEAGYRDIQYRDGDIDMAEQRMQLNYRVPDLQRLTWAQNIVTEMGDRLPKTQQEIYAREQLLLHERQSTQIVVQALRIADICIATTPNETYALTGLKLKLQSPKPRTMVIELANGGDGYIPPPEQHLLGGYNTWAARSAGLEVDAEPRITEAALQLLEKVCGQPRKKFIQSSAAASDRIRDLKPLAWWRLDEFSGPWAHDSSGQHHHGTFEPAIAYFLQGAEAFDVADEKNRATHFAGDRMSSRLGDVGRKYSISMWIWNGMPVDARAVTGWMYSRGPNHGLPVTSEHLGISGSAGNPGCLVFQNGAGAVAQRGTTAIKRWTWNHVALVHDGDQVRIHLNGRPKPEVTATAASLSDQLWFFGGRCDNDSNWEGRLDEICVFPRVLTTHEIASLAASSAEQ